MSSILNSNSASPTMSSKEIADLTEKQHDNFKRTMVAMASQGVISHPQIEDGIRGPNGVAENLYLVGKRDSLVVVAQLSPEFTARIVDRWQELEQQAVTGFNPSSLSRMDILKMTMDSEEGRLKAEAEFEALDRIYTPEGSLCIRDVAKDLQVQEKP